MVVLRNSQEVFKISWGCFCSLKAHRRVQARAASEKTQLPEKRGPFRHKKPKGLSFCCFGPPTCQCDLYHSDQAEHPLIESRLSVPWSPREMSHPPWWHIDGLMKEDVLCHKCWWRPWRFELWSDCAPHHVGELWHVELRDLFTWSGDCKAIDTFDAPPGRVYGRVCSKTKAHFSSFWHRVFSMFFGLSLALEILSCGNPPWRYPPTRPMFETTTGLGNPCAPLTLNSSGRSRVSSSSWPFSAVVCESFVFAQSCAILEIQWRAEFVVAFVLVRVSTSIRGVLLLLSFLSPVSPFSPSYWFSHIIAPLHNYHCNRWLGFPPPERWRFGNQRNAKDVDSKESERDIIT